MFPREYTELESYQTLVWEMFKDANGFRPRGIYSDAQWSDLEFLKAEVEYLSVRVDEEIAREKQMELEAIAEFESTIDHLISIGAKTRETALRWFISAQEEYMQMDLEHLCWHLGLPYKYIKAV